MPFAVKMPRPVTKVVCGELFGGLLTSQGEVFTWGWNIFGQLGLKETTIGVTLDPQQVTFEKSDFIIDLACG